MTHSEGLAATRKVSDEQFQAFSDAIVAFWRDVPQNVFASQVTDVPDWFGKAIK